LIVGKPYRTELERLPDTFSWCLRAPVSELSSCIRSGAELPLLAVGSGGSYTSAAFSEHLHQACTGRMAQAMTPLEAVHAPLDLRSIGVLIMSAGGKNPDVIGTFSRLSEREPRSLVALCTRIGTPLGRLASRSGRSRVVEFDIPSGKDGFLATNSLFATIVLLIRAYETAGLLKSSLPDDFSGLLTGHAEPDAFYEGLSSRASSLWGRSTLVVLYGPSARAAAVDVESRFSESALGNVQIADYRNFAHGRHYWLESRRRETAVIAFVTEDMAGLAERTLRLIPEDIPVLRIELPGGWVAASLSGILQSMYLARAAGEAAGVDPGRPTVPEFGRRLYRLPAFRARTGRSSLPRAEMAAIERKSKSTILSLESGGALEGWRAAYRAFTSTLKGAQFGGVVFDYDGTLCEASERFEGPRREVTEQLERLLRAGVVVGIATGRGKSVKEQLRERLSPSLWGRMPIAYYNGSEVGLLGDDAIPEGGKALAPPFDSILELLSRDGSVAGGCTVDANRHQISVVPVGAPGGVARLWECVRSVLDVNGLRDVRVLRSDHSVDILDNGSSKLAVLAAVRGLAGGDGGVEILRVGDRGCWPGNDCELLSGPHSLSVDETSADPGSCWNIASPGASHTAALLEYLELLVCGSGLASFSSHSPGEAAR
jgi:hypothetical protein